MIESVKDAGSASFVSGEATFWKRPMRPGGVALVLATYWASESHLTSA